jgi:hypothetical protein
MIRRHLGPMPVCLLAVVAATLLAGQAYAQFNVLYTFDGTTNIAPSAAPIVDAAGNLYGASNYGGPGACLVNGFAIGCGVVFELSPSAGGYTLKVLHTFRGPDGSYPDSLVMDAAGNLYGTSRQGGGSKNCKGGCGTVFKLTRGSSGGWTFSTLYTFIGTSVDGWLPASIVLDGKGNLFGVTFQGGARNIGTAFELSPLSTGGWGETVINSFSGDHGCLPNSLLTIDAAGNLYGTTFQCGSGFEGVAYKLSHSSSGWKETVLQSFGQSIGIGNNGSFPRSGVFVDHAGNVYGTTEEGGPAAGMVFQLTPVSNGPWKESVLASFATFTDGQYPRSNIIQDKSGNLWGTAEQSGDASCGNDNIGCGTVFELTPGSGGQWNYNVIHTFTGGIDGSSPGNLFTDPAGRIYGTSSSNSGAVLFQLTQ